MVYLLYSFIFFLVGLLIAGQNESKRLYYYFFFLLIVLFWGLSYYDAPDTPGYIEKYKYDIQTIYGHVDRQFEIGYTLLAMLFKTLHLNYWVFQFVVFAIEIWLIIRGIRYFFDDESLMYIIPLLFFIYPTNLAAFRQGIAIALFIYALHFINDENFKKSLYFFLFVLIASLFHQSALFLTIVYMARFTGKLLAKDWLLFTILIIGDVIWSAGATLESQLDFLIPFFRGDLLNMGDKYANLIESESMESFGFAKVLEMNATVVLYTLFCKEDKEYGLMRFNMMMYVSIGLVLGGILAHRLLYYWTLLYYICFIYSFVSLFRKLNLTVLSYFLIATYMFWFFVFKSGFIQRDFSFLFGY